MIDFYNLSLMTKLTNLYILYKICKLHINYIEGENMNISMYTYQKQIERIYRKLNHRSTGFLRPYYEKYQISELQYRVLSHIQEHTACTIGACAKALQQDAGNMSVTCKKLKKLGYIFRKRSVSDERVVLLYPTESGKACIHTIHDAMYQHYQKQWNYYNDKDKELIVKGLQKLEQFIEMINEKEDPHE